MRNTAGLLLLMLPVVLFAQQPEPQKFALVIGNSEYRGISNLRNPVNDANDMEAALRALGFTVEKILNGNLEQMENAVLGLSRKLGGSSDSYGFFYYAGHGVQSGGDNYLIPTEAGDIRSETHLRTRAVPLQFVLDTMSGAENELNMVVLDACRDNPFGWARSSSRGLSVVSRAPTGSIVMYATGANSTAEDGAGRNGLFTGHLLNNLKTQGLSVFDVFDKTMGDVIRNTGGKQHPELSLRYAGATSAYLGTPPARVGPSVTGPVTVVPATPYSPPAKPEKAKDLRLHSIGASVGTSFSAPWFVGTVHGTFSPFRNSFIEAGLDIGLASGVADLDYYSFYPFARYAFYFPFAGMGWYAGGGPGYMFSYFSYQDKKTSVNTFAVDLAAGLIILDSVNISYSFRTNFKGVSNKIAVGYIYRF